MQRVLLGIWVCSFSWIAVGAGKTKRDAQLVHSLHRISDLKSRTHNRNRYASCLRPESCIHRGDCDVSIENETIDPTYIQPHYKPRKYRPGFRLLVKRALISNQQTPHKQHIICFRCAKSVQPGERRVHIDHYGDNWQFRRKDEMQTLIYGQQSPRGQRARLRNLYNAEPLRATCATCNLTRTKAHTKEEQTPEQKIASEIAIASAKRLALFGGPFPSPGSTTDANLGCEELSWAEEIPR